MNKLTKSILKGTSMLRSRSSHAQQLNTCVGALQELREAIKIQSIMISDVRYYLEREDARIEKLIEILKK